MSPEDSIDWFNFRSGPARRVKGGIKAQTKQGAFAQSWWGKRWLEVLESFQLGSRLQRGRSYARRGQIISIEVKRGSVKARVQGSRRTPYAVLLQVKAFSAAQLDKARKAVGAQAFHAAKLLAGEMPPELETILREAGLELFPQRADDLRTECSCPDWSNPCKHIAAVYYLLAEQFDHDPFLLLKLRGIEREQFLQEIKSSQPSAARTGEPEPLRLERETFWNGKELPRDWPGEGRTGAASAGLARRLGPLRFWRGEERFQEAMDRLYRKAMGGPEAGRGAAKGGKQRRGDVS